MNRLRNLVSKLTAALMCEQSFAGIRNISTLITEKVRMDIGAKSASASVKIDMALPKH
jgi:hypothetical protein